MEQVLSGLLKHASIPGAVDVLVRSDDVYRIVELSRLGLWAESVAIPKLRWIYDRADEPCSSHADEALARLPHDNGD